MPHDSEPPSGPPPSAPTPGAPGPPEPPRPPESPDPSEPAGSTVYPTGETATARFRRSDTARVEAFSDGVFAIAVTVLVLEIGDPDHREGHLGHALLEQWPAYLGYLASFGYVGVIWLNHHQAFARVRSVDRGLQAANLLLLGVTAALAFPTGVLSDALREDVFGSDARVAAALYALVAAAMCAAWLLLYTHLRHRPGLLDRAVEPEYVRHGQLRSAVGVGAYAVAGLLGWAVTPVAALAVFVLLPVFYFATSEGLPHRRPRAAP
jgi:uncharacterized membrane protein